MVEAVDTHHHVLVQSRIEGDRDAGARVPGGGPGQLQVGNDPAGCCVGVVAVEGGGVARDGDRRQRCQDDHDEHELKQGEACTRLKADSSQYVLYGVPLASTSSAPVLAVICWLASV